MKKLNFEDIIFGIFTVMALAWYYVSVTDDEPILIVVGSLFFIKGLLIWLFMGERKR